MKTSWPCFVLENLKISPNESSMHGELNKVICKTFLQMSTTFRDESNEPT
jgi:hypothetical protein